jgi:hypothetical protein
MYCGRKVRRLDALSSRCGLTHAMQSVSPLCSQARAPQFGLETPLTRFGKSIDKEGCYLLFSALTETTHAVQPHPRIVVCPSSFCFPLMIPIFIFVFSWLGGRLAISHEMEYLSYKEDGIEWSSLSSPGTHP